MALLLFRRGLQLLLVLWAISTLLFFLIRLSGDPAALIAGPQADPAQIDSIRSSLGLDDPLLVQYGRFLSETVRLDFGASYQYRVPAMSAVLDRFPASLQLTAGAVALALCVAIPTGIIAAVRRGRPSGQMLLAGSLLGQSVPNFVLGIMLILVFAVQLNWFPSFGREGLASMVLPTVTLSAFMMARQTRLVRAYMVEELSKDYVRSAEANGVPVWRIRFKYALKNVLVPVFALAGIDLGQMFGGAVITEAIFAWPGVGRLLVDSVLMRDYPVVQAAVFSIAVLVVLVNFGVDLINRFFDPVLRSELR